MRWVQKAEHVPVWVAPARVVPAASTEEAKREGPGDELEGRRYSERMWRLLGKVMPMESRSIYARQVVMVERQAKQARMLYDERIARADERAATRPLIVSAALMATDDVEDEEKNNYEAAFQFDVGHNPSFVQRQVEMHPLWELTESGTRLKAPARIDKKYLQRYRVDPDACGGCSGYQYQGRELLSMTKDDCRQF